MKKREKKKPPFMVASDFKISNFKTTDYKLVSDNIFEDCEELIEESNDSCPVVLDPSCDIHYCVPPFKI